MPSSPQHRLSPSPEPKSVQRPVSADVVTQSLSGDELKQESDRCNFRPQARGGNHAPESDDLLVHPRPVGPGVDLRTANLSRVELFGANLLGANLSGVDLAHLDLSSACLDDAMLTGANAHRADLSEASLRGCDLSGADLSEAYLGGANLEGANLQGANLRGANLWRASLKTANLEAADLEGSNLEEANFQGCCLKSAILRGCDWGETILRDADLRQAMLTAAKLSCSSTSSSSGAGAGAEAAGVDLQGSNLSGAQLGGSDLRGVNLTHADLTQTNLRGADLTNADLKNANLTRATLAKATLELTKLDNATLDNVNLEGARLRKIDLENANLRAAKMNRVYLYKTKLDGADLESASLNGAEVLRTSFFGARLEGARFRKADLTDVTFKHAEMNCATFENCKMMRCSWERCRLRNTVWRKARVLGKPDFRGADLAEADLSGVTMPCAVFESSDLWRANLTDAILPRANLEGANLCSANLKGCDLSAANLKGARLESADLERANLTKACLESADLERAKLRNAVLYGADLKECRLGLKAKPDLEGADLRFAVLSGLDLEGASLKGAMLGNAICRNTNFDHVSFDGLTVMRVDWSNASLNHTTWRGADMRCGVFEGAAMEGITLDQKTSLGLANLHGANFVPASVPLCRVPLRCAALYDHVEDDVVQGRGGAGEDGATRRGRGIKKKGRLMLWAQKIGGAAATEVVGEEEEFGGREQNAGTDEEDTDSDEEEGYDADAWEDWDDNKKDEFLILEKAVAAMVEAACEDGHLNAFTRQCGAAMVEFFHAQTSGEGISAAFLERYLSSSSSSDGEVAVSSEEARIRVRFAAARSASVVGRASTFFRICLRRCDRDIKDPREPRRLVASDVQLPSPADEDARPENLVSISSSGNEAADMEHFSEDDTLVRCESVARMCGGGAILVRDIYDTVCDFCAARNSTHTQWRCKACDYNLCGPCYAAKRERNRTIMRGIRSQDKISSSSAGRTSVRTRRQARSRPVYRQLLSFLTKWERRHQIETDRAASKPMFLRKQFAQIRRRLRDAQLNYPSGFEASSWSQLARRMLWSDPRILHRQLKDMDFVLDRLQRAENTPIEEKSWQDFVESIVALRDLLPKVRTQRAVRVLECIFGDEELLKAVGLGELMMGIIGGEATPPVLLTRLKADVGAHLKQNFYEYTVALEAEQTSIRRVIALQDRCFSAVGAMIAGVFFGAANFAFKMMHDHWWMPGEFQEF